MNDERIVELYASRNEDAIAETQRKYGRKLNRLSFCIVRNEEDADECENDTYLKAWNSIPPQSPKTYLFSYLGKITRNLSINRYNRNHADKRCANIVELTQEMEACIPSPSDDGMKISESDLSQVINRFLFSLKETERDIFVKRYWFCDSIKEIAFDYDFSESKTKSMLMRTRNKMKKYFEREGIHL